MPLGISGTFNFMIVFQAEHNILMHPETFYCNFRHNAALQETDNSFSFLFLSQWCCT
jgi:hypothetical protein